MSPRGDSARRPVRAKSLISQLRREPNPLRMKLLLLGYITDRLEKRSETIFLVGGQAVETYTVGQFTTGDIDITTSDRKSAEKILRSLGFREIGMIWLNEQLGVAVQIVGEFLSGSYERTLTIKVGPYNVRVIGIEDLIIDRLAAAKFWESARDLERARALLSSFRDRIDRNYLKRTAKKKRVENILAKASRS